MKTLPGVGGSWKGMGLPLSDKESRPSHVAYECRRSRRSFQQCRCMRRLSSYLPAMYNRRGLGCPSTYSIEVPLAHPLPLCWRQS